MSRLEAAIEKRLEDGRFYDAHQMTKTIISRLCTKGDFQEALDTCLRFAIVFSSAEQYELAADLGNIAIETAISGAKVRDEDPAKQFCQEDIQEMLITINSEIPPNATRERVKFLENAIRASKCEEFKRGHPVYHALLGQVHLDEGRPGPAVLQLVLCGESHGDSLIAAMDAAVKSCYASEVGLFILRTVLILLTLEEVALARKVVQHFSPKNEEERPEIHVQLAYLITEAAAAKDLDFLDEVKGKYQLLFRRDSQLNAFVEATERTMGRAKAAPTGLAALFGSLMG